ncbi:MAG: hypothetical protein QM831_07575 [Kofleriaceae bacterium]
MTSPESPAAIRRLLRRNKRDAEHVILQLIVPLDADDSTVASQYVRGQRVLHDLRTYVWGTAQKKKKLAGLAADRAALVAIRGAAARGTHVTLSMLGVLALDGEPDSIDALLPHLDPALSKADHRLDWIKGLKKLPITSPAVKKILAEVDDTLAARNAVSPALALGPVIGIGEIDVLKFDCRFHTSGRTDGGVQVDSTKASWFHVWVRTGEFDSGKETSFRNDRVIENSLKLGACDAKDLPAYFARAQIALKCKFQWIAPYTNLRGKKRDQLMTWLSRG